MKVPIGNQRLIHLKVPRKQTSLIIWMIMLRGQNPKRVPASPNHLLKNLKDNQSQILKRLGSPPSQALRRLRLKNRLKRLNMRISLMISLMMAFLVMKVMNPFWMIMLNQNLKPNLQNLLQKLQNLLKDNWMKMKIDIMIMKEKEQILFSI